MALKDGFSKIDTSNYVIDSVRVESTKKSLGKIFQNLKANNLNRGIIKIDVEGFEFNIIKGISLCIPDNFQLILIFENWDERFNFSTLEELFPNKKIKISRIEKSVNGEQNSKLLKLINLLLGHSEITYLIPHTDSLSKIGDHVDVEGARYTHHDENYQHS